MSVNVRSRRVTDLFGDEAKARLGRQLSYASSGSEHAAEAESDSPCLSELVHGFFLEDCESVPEAAPGYDSDSDRVGSVEDCTDQIEDIVRQAIAGNVDSSYVRLLRQHVAAAAEAFSCLRSADKSVFRRKVMTSLQEMGHNAAICKTRWSSSGGLTAGNHEFIDVIQPIRSPSGVQRQPEQEQIRYLIDLDFAGEFEVARPTEQYTRLLQLLPRVFVGLGDDLKRIARAMSAAAKRSLKSRGLSLPPWKKNRYMQSKWLGPYRRTANSSPSISLTPAASSVVKCRAIGFDDAINGRLSVRTR